MKTDKLQLIATAPMGLETLVSRELRELGYSDCAVENGRVTFEGDMVDIARTNLWLRTADRVLVKMGEFPAKTFEDLFEGTKSLDWPDWIPIHGEFPVQGRSHKSQLSSVPACQSIVKKAIVERMKQQYRSQWFEETGPLFTVEVSMMNDIATLTLDTTGPSLHKRGYRKLVTEAPLKETMAAAMVMLSRWHPERPLYDPFCGSGTLLIEAAMIGWNIAPGLRRSFPSESWGVIGEERWKEARDEALDGLRDEVKLEISGSDIDPEAIKVAEAAVRKAGLSKEIKMMTKPVKQIHPQGDYGVLVTNPPYGERLGDGREAENAIRQLGSVCKQLDTWSFFVLSPNKNFEHYFERQADKKRKLFNGRIECNLYQYFGPGGVYGLKKS